jgi:hypothetical protein
MTTKHQLVADAFGELALAVNDFDITPEEEAQALRRLETLMATWASQGIRVGYVFGSDLDAESGLPLVADEAVYMALAVRLAAGKGKQLPPNTLRNAKAAYDALISAIARDQVQQQQLASGTPRGAGRKAWRTLNQPYVTAPNIDPLQVSADGGLDLLGN